MNVRELEDVALKIRMLTIKSIGDLGVGHIGGSMSVIEVLTALYFSCMSVFPDDPLKMDRDRLVLSKGHAGPALYAALALRGFFPVEWLATLNRGGTKLPSHCDRNLTPGVDMTTGSLGQGLSAAIGMALGLRMNRVSNYVFAIIGDGETQEGQVWEAAMAAAHFLLDRLIVFTDCNKLNIDGYTREIMNLENLEAKWSAFNWAVQRVDGHSFPDILRAIDQAKVTRGRPSMIILRHRQGEGMHFRREHRDQSQHVGDPCSDRPSDSQSPGSE